MIVWPMTVNKVAYSNDASCLFLINLLWFQPTECATDHAQWHHSLKSPNSIMSLFLPILHFEYIYMYILYIQTWDMESVATFWHNTCWKVFTFQSRSKSLYVLPFKCASTDYCIYILLRFLTVLTIKIQWW